MATRTKPKPRKPRTIETVGEFVESVESNLDEQSGEVHETNGHGEPLAAAPSPVVVEEVKPIEEKPKSDADYLLAVEAAERKVKETGQDWNNSKAATKEFKSLYDGAVAELCKAARAREQKQLDDAFRKKIAEDAIREAKEKEQANDAKRPLIQEVEKAEWRTVGMDALDLPAHIVKKLAAKDIETIGALADFTAGDKPLTWIDGIGKGASEKIEDAMMEFWKKNPEVQQAATA